MSDILISRINERLGELDISARWASLQVGENADLIRNILRGKSESPRIDTIEKIAAVLKTTPEWLTGKSEISTAPVTGEIRPGAAVIPARERMPNDVPVRGTAAGSHMSGAFQLDSSQTVDWARRPPAMTGARDLYALYIEGTSMEPEHRPGDLRFVHPHKPARIGDSVIVQIRNGRNSEIEAIIGHYLKKTPTTLVIGKLSPVATVEVKREHVVAVYKVLTMNELFGL